MKTIFLIIFLIISFMNHSQITNNHSIHQFQVEDLYGDSFDFQSLQGKKVMLVNTASECGLTPQYEKLQALFEKYQSSDFVIVGFPANNFGEQEPGTNKEIALFCQENYGVSFPMMAKISVKGDDQHPVYQFLTSKSKNGVMDSEVNWNFQKYLINQEGKLIDVIHHSTEPDDPKIINWIESE
ncbi:MAG: glutathione peroxidase [Flavobacteriaceae bacterium]|nr:glutathione peroxidase [Flavobacteriaceae bacterium]MCY4267976.1 glutathione peroxidase [Flavobacteriaceae bacterium]